MQSLTGIPFRSAVISIISILGSTQAHNLSTTIFAILFAAITLANGSLLLTQVIIQANTGLGNLLIDNCDAFTKAYK